MVAVISGRDTDFLASALSIDHLVLVGNHGLEERRAGESQLIPQAVPYARALASTAESVEVLVNQAAPGATVERKRATIAVHVRRTADPAAAAQALRPRLAGLAASNGLELREGRLVFELRPPIHIDKGEVIDRLLARSAARSVIFAGDDTTDADAFTALRRWRGRGLQTVAVAVRSTEVASHLFRDTDIVVDGVPGIVQLLRTLAGGRA